MYNIRAMGNILN